MSRYRIVVKQANANLLDTPTVITCDEEALFSVIFPFTLMPNLVVDVTTEKGTAPLDNDPEAAVRRADDKKKE
jgi:hypothetical protein